MHFQCAVSLCGCTCVRLKALYIKHYNNTQPNLITHYISHSVPPSPPASTHARAHPLPPPHTHTRNLATPPPPPPPLLPTPLPSYPPKSSVSRWRCQQPKETTNKQNKEPSRTASSACERVRQEQLRVGKSNEKVFFRIRIGICISCPSTSLQGNLSYDAL